MLMLAGCDGILGEGRLPNQAANNLKAIGLGMHVYQSANLTLPPRAIMGEGGKPLLSWRVAMLPYLGMGELYWEFKTDERHYLTRYLPLQTVFAAIPPASA
jgi:hypothetical protein